MRVAAQLLRSSVRERGDPRSREGIPERWLLSGAPNDRRRSPVRIRNLAVVPGVLFPKQLSAADSNKRIIKPPFVYIIQAQWQQQQQNTDHNYWQIYFLRFSDTVPGSFLMLSKTPEFHRICNKINSAKAGKYERQPLKAPSNCLRETSHALCCCFFKRFSKRL